MDGGVVRSEFSVEEVLWMERRQEVPLVACVTLRVYTGWQTGVAPLHATALNRRASSAGEHVDLVTMLFGSKDVFRLFEDGHTKGMAH